MADFSHSVNALYPVPSKMLFGERRSVEVSGLSATQLSDKVSPFQIKARQPQFYPWLHTQSTAFYSPPTTSRNSLNHTTVPFLEQARERQLAKGRDHLSSIVPCAHRRKSDMKRRRRWWEDSRVLGPQRSTSTLTKGGICSSTFPTCIRDALSIGSSISHLVLQPEKYSLSRYRMILVFESINVDVCATNRIASEKCLNFAWTGPSMLSLDDFSLEQS